MTLHWQKIFKPNELSNNDSIIRGIYIWGFRINDSFKPYYVGVASNVNNRLFEHLNYLISGRYTIYKSTDLSLFNESSVNPVYKPYWPNSFLEFLKNKSALDFDINFMLNNSEFTFAQVDEEIDLKEVEKYLINLIGKSNLANTRGGESKISRIQFDGDLEMLEVLNRSYGI